MPQSRGIRKIIPSTPSIEGAGVHLKRAFGFRGVRQFDPFLLLDDFRGEKPLDYIKGFPWHPHRGIETITYVLGGRVEHGDSMGNSGVIGPGDIQWMTAGSGVIHQEMPKGDDAGRLAGFQLWANLPAAHKMMDPRYRGLTSDEIPQVALAGGVTVKVICGQVKGTPGPVRDILTDPQYLDVTVPAGSEFTHPTPRGHTALAYAIEGKAFFCKEKDPFAYEVEGKNYFDMDRKAFVANEDLVLFGDGDRVVVATEEEPVRFLLMCGKPLGEPIAWYGPIVMNTQEELRIAFEEYEQGTFIKKR